MKLRFWKVVFWKAVLEMTEFQKVFSISFHHQRNDWQNCLIIWTEKTRRRCKRRGAGMCDDYDQFSWWLNVSHKVLICSKREVFCGVLACHSGDFFKYNWQKLAAVFLPSFCDSKGFFKWNLGETQVHTQIFKRIY